MKNILIIIGLTLLLTSFAQEQVKITVCEKINSEIKIKDLVSCKFLTTNSKEYKVISFSIGFMFGEEYIEGTMTDNEISGNIIDRITKVNPDVIYIERIVLINKTGDELKIDPIKVKK